MLGHYLRLIRLPNVFTAPSNVFVGYTAALSDKGGDGVVLGGLAVSSVLLYISGVVLNDYFDIEVDRVERPDRPLPSGKVRKKTAAILAISAIVAANLIAAVVSGAFALAVSLSLSALIVAYDYRLKSWRVAGPFAMAGSRSLNVLLGASPAIPLFFVGTGVEPLMLGMSTVFCYALAIMALSRTEVRGATKKRYVFVAGGVAAIIAAVGLGGHLIGMQLWFIPMLALLAAAMAFTFWRYRPQGQLTSSPVAIQHTIRNMVVCVILLDSVFVAGFAGLTFGLATLLFLIPATLLARKLYVT